MKLNLADLYQFYVNQENINSQEKSNLNTTLFKYTLPELGFIIPKRSLKRFHQGDIELAINFCKDIYISEDIREKLTSIQEQYFKKNNLSYTIIRHNRRVLKNFFDCLDRVIKRNELPDKFEKKYLSSRIKVADFSLIEQAKVKRKNKKIITLSFDYKNYHGKALNIKKELERIESELFEFEKFLQAIKNSKRTRSNYIKVLKTLLGWQYIKNQDLTKVGINKLIIKYDFYPKRNYIPDQNSYENYINYMVSRSEAIDKSREYAKQTIDFINNFFDEYEVKAKRTKEGYICGLIALAKYLYKDITDIEENNNYEDVSVIKRLRIINNSTPNDNKKIQPELPKWDLIIKVLYELKRSCDQTKNTQGRLLPKSTLAYRLQKFLALGFLALVPPPRQRIIRELSLGKTLKHGDYVDGIFIPYEKLVNKSQASYYVHLQPEDYKTGKTYGEWLGKFNNFIFPDGTNFYDYLNRWINEYRAVMLENDPDHGFLFMCSQTKKSHTKSTMSAYISWIFKSTIELNLSPHNLRIIYRTYLADIGADQKILDSSAFWMRHSPKVAKIIYTKQSLDNKLTPGAEAIAAINGKLLLS